MEVKGLTVSAMRSNSTSCILRHSSTAIINAISFPDANMGLDAAFDEFACNLCNLVGFLLVFWFPCT